MIDPERVQTSIQSITKSRKNWRSREACRGKTFESFKEEMKKEYDYLATKCPILFDKSLNGDFEKGGELDKLNYMLGMMNKVNKKNTSFEDASKAVGQRFADEYVKPLVEKLDREKKEKELEEQSKIEEIED
jgi:uncharacterized protein YukE